MIEPTENESIESLDRFIKVMIEIAKGVEENPQKVKQGSYNTVEARLDEATASRKPKLRW